MYDTYQDNTDKLPAPTEPIALPDRIPTPPSPAVQMAVHQGSPNRIKVFNPQTSTDTPPQIPKDDQNRPMNDQQELADAFRDDSFVEQIKTRSPAKRVSRIEDSVEALDALEDEIEKIGEAIPATTSDTSSPRESRKPANAPAKSQAEPSKFSKTTSKSSSGHATTPSTVSKSNKNVTKPSSRPSASNSQRPTEIKSTNCNKSPSRALNIKGVAERSQPPKRVSSIHKAPFQPVKSTKPPTKSTFELPGEAIGRKLKEQREQRQKREEEGEDKNRQAKTKRVRNSQAPEVKMTATARARLSLAQTQTENTNLSATSQAQSKPINSKRQSTLAGRVNFSQPLKRASPPANTSAKRGPSLTASISSRQPSSMSQSQSVAGISAPKAKGKEVYARPKMMLSEKESEKRAKEEAAKKARTEAAERGRLASREWAEKQKARKLAAQKAKEGGGSGTD